ncbi:MAG TPA: recombinase family protein [Solirubrobacterales bacterium]|nr:recombinase family protein [Solirubrobacterales bacterium]
MPTPVVIYAAKSTADKHRSIGTQLEDCRQKAADEGWEIVGEFEDEKLSAYSGNRGKGLQDAKQLATAVADERAEVCMLVAQASDRFARGEGDKPGAADALIEIWHALRRLNVHLHSVEDDGDLRDSPSVANLGHRAMMESKRKSGAVAKGMKRRRAKGLAHGGTRRFGYRFGEGAVLIRVEAERLVVARMFDEFLAGKSDSAIMRGLTADGVATAGGRKWHAATVRAILVNPLYAGMLSTKEGVIAASHDPCVSEEVFAKAQALRAARNKVGQGRGRPPVGKHLFRKGMLKCGCGCEGSMVPRTSRSAPSRPGRNPSETYYSYERMRDSSLCSMPPVKRAEVDSAVYSYFEQVGLDVDATRAQLAEARDHKLVEVRGLLGQAETEARRADERLARVRRDYTDGKLSAEDWAEFRQEITAEREGAAAALDRLADRVTEVEAWGELADSERDTLAMLADLRSAVAGEISDAQSTEAVRAVLARLFDHFVLRRADPKERVYADLAWQGDYIIEPIAKEQAVKGYEGLRPIFRREPIYDAGNNSGVAQATKSTMKRASSPNQASERLGVGKRGALSPKIPSR